MEVCVLGQEPADFDLRVRTELDSAEQLQDERFAKEQRGVALFTAKDADRFGLPDDAGMCRREDQSAAPFGGYFSTGEALQERTANRRIVEALGQHVRLGWTVLVAHLNQAQRRARDPARAIDDARAADGAAFPAEPARLAQFVDHAAQRGISTRNRCAGWTCGSSRTQL